MQDNLRELRTEAVDDFLKMVYTLQREVDPVPTSLLARSLNITAPSVTDMIKRLAGAEDEKKDKDRKQPPRLLDYEPYRGVRLTPEGETIALEVIRHHRLIELYLSRALGYSWDEVHEEADRLEHYISERLEARIAAALGHPEMDPHGDPIPALDGSIADRELMLLADLPSGALAAVSRIADQTPEVLRYLSELGLKPGASIAVVQHSPLNDTLTIRIGEDKRATHTISAQIARKVLITTVTRQPRNE